MKIVLNTFRKESSAIFCESGIFRRTLAPMREEFLARGALVFTDENVLRLYGGEIKEVFGEIPVHAMRAGEAYKNEETLFSLLGAMAAAGLRRNSVLIALGGGVVGDVGGLAASLYMRGIGCILVPTTLLAQADASVGGKTAIDFCGVKNLVGAFSQPREVYADPDFFATLPPREIRCGLGEIVKHGALSPALFDRLYENRARLSDPEFLGRIIPENIAFKASVVRKDPHEAGERKSLNLGHTTAHALELGGCGLSHGECVLWGLIFEGMLARRHLGADEEFTEKLFTLCRSALGGGMVPSVKGARLALLDKKNTSPGKVTLTVPLSAGNYALLELPAAQYEEELLGLAEELC